LGKGYHNRMDYYYRKAKVEGYRSRAAYKLKEINKKYNVIRKGDIVVDLGAAPGGWIQVSREIVGDKGLIIGVDINQIERFPWNNVITIQADITEENIVEIIREAIPNGSMVDVVLSDAAPKISGIWDTDHARQIFIAENALKIAKELLKPDGRCVIKVFQGPLLNDFIDKVKREFMEVKIFKPNASRKESSEVYVIARKRKI